MTRDAFGFFLFFLFFCLGYGSGGVERNELPFFEWTGAAERLGEAGSLPLPNGRKINDAARSFFSAECFEFFSYFWNDVEK